MTKPKKKIRSDAEYRALGRMIEDLYLAQTTTPAHLIWYSFLRGLAYGTGIVLAGTIIIGILIWILGLFNGVPLIGPLLQNIVNDLK